MSLTLVLNAAEGPLQLLVGTEAGILCEQCWNAPQRGTEILAPALALVFDRLALRMTDLDRIACVSGPGSFTGVRLVLATAAGLRRTGHALTAGLDFLHALALTAQNKLQASDGQTIWILTHARRNLVHCQAFAPHAGAVPDALETVTLCTPAEALQHIQAHAMKTGTSPVLCGSGVQRQLELFQRACPQALLLPASLNLPSMQALWQLAQAAVYTDGDIAPYYVRSCDAVDNLPALAPRLGLSGEEACRRLDALLTRVPAPQDTPEMRHATEQEACLEEKKPFSSPKASAPFRR